MPSYFSSSQTVYPSIFFHCEAILCSALPTTGYQNVPHVSLVTVYALIEPREHYFFDRPLGGALKGHIWSHYSYSPALFHPLIAQKESNFPPYKQNHRLNTHLSKLIIVRFALKCLEIIFKFQVKVSVPETFILQWRFAFFS